MARTEGYPSISDIASQVLREVRAEDQVKTAEVQILRGAVTPALPETNTAAELRKLAQECRQQSDDITLADLQEFMTNAR
jgi:nitrogenase subunit NifH